MTDFERDEIYELPDKYKPISTWGYVGYAILFGIPFVGLIAAIAMACSKNNVNVRNYGRAGLLIVAISFVLTLWAML